MICSAVGPVRGYTMSVRTAVRVRGAEIECTESMDGDVKGPALEMRDVVRWKPEDARLKTEPVD